MTYFKTGVTLLFLTLLFTSCTRDENSQDKLDNELKEIIRAQSPDNNLNFFILPSSEDLLAIPQDPDNPLTKEKIALGGFLFHETALGTGGTNEKSKKTYSCASCHHADAGFQSGIIQGIGEGGTGFGFRGEGRIPAANHGDVDTQPVKSPSVMNGAYQTNMSWSGQFGATHLNKGTENKWYADTPLEANHLGYQGMETQAIAEIGIHRLNIDENILLMPTYKKLFATAFPSNNNNRQSLKEQAGLAIAAYLRTVMSNQAPFQKYLRGDNTAMNNQEKIGAKIFFSKAKCSSCHTGPALNSMQFNAIGMGDMIDCPENTLKTSQNNPENLGRASFTHKTEDNFKFKVPQLYNLKDTRFFGHGSSLRSIKDVIIYKNKAIAENNGIAKEQLDSNFIPLGLTPEEIDALNAFISNSLYDPNLSRYKPQQLPSGLCFPNADLQSKRDMDCY